MTKKTVISIGGGNPPTLVDISTPLPPVKVIPGPMPKIEKPFLQMLDDMEREIQVAQRYPEHEKLKLVKDKSHDLP